ncbi:MAG: Eco57I restriction-modification methylase domain-containing protein [Gammaproteobacteria bacterium AqS3]|nr:Eco57I restriction-modification methylase domain-containing protein [Gammaproteobacteria bacterium AqS3]
MSCQVEELFKGCYERDLWFEVLHGMFNEDLKLLARETRVRSADVKSCVQLGSVTLSGDDDKKIGLFEIEINPGTQIHRNRVQLRNVVAKALERRGLDGALAVYHGTEQAGSWRLSFMGRGPELNPDTGTHVIKWTDSKQFTYLLGPEQRVRTAVQSFRTISDTDRSLQSLEKAFSVKELNKEFYKELEKWYDKAVEQIKLPRLGNNATKRSISVIRLITRLLFVWFIKEKRLINEDLFDEEKIRACINYKKPSSYYKAILQNLFFATLNQDVVGRKMDEDDPKAYHYYSDSSAPLFAISDQEAKNLFKTSPLINGGLFECNEEDGFSKKDAGKVYIPNELFFNADDTGLIQILKRYQFTVEESTPLDVDVALDPELLGRVFENLLACHNPETSETARKETGSFYTTRPIVNYIINEALRFRLSQQDEEIDPGWKGEIDKLIDKLDDPLSGENTENIFDEVQTKRLISIIHDIKIIDPAVGSGAFPMGVLHKLVGILKLVDPENSKWKDKHLENARKISDSHAREKAVKEIQDDFSKYGDYSRKLYLIQNNIFGIDTQSIAIEIAKLRFFISLAIEQDKDGNADNYGIKPLPNLETNFIAADSLLHLDGPPLQQDILDGNRLKDYLDGFQAIRERYFNAHSDIEKAKCKDGDEELREKIYQYSQKSDMSKDHKKVVEKISSWKPYDKNHSAGWFNSEWMFNVESFDIVIGNPPYIQLQKSDPNGKSDEKYADRYKGSGYGIFDRTGDIYQLFYERGHKLLNQKGCLCFITSNKWMRTKYGKKMRAFLGKEAGNIRLIDLGAGMFETATVDTNILLFSKNRAANNLIKYYTVPPSLDGTPFNFEGIEFQEMPVPEDGDGWVLLSPAELALKEKIERVGTPLKEWHISINYGIRGAR